MTMTADRRRPTRVRARPSADDVIALAIDDLEALRRDMAETCKARPATEELDAEVRRIAARVRMAFR